MNKYDWLFLVAAVVMTAVALTYQVKFYKLVDDLISALTQDNEKTPTE